MTRWAAPALLAALLSFSACAGPESGDSTDEGSSTSTLTESNATEQAESEGGAERDAAPAEGAEDAGAENADAPDEQSSIIHTGSVSLHSKDVEKARLDAQKVVDQHGGKIADEESHTDTDGQMSSSRMVLRVPSGDFDAVMTELGEVAEVTETTRSSEDVTTQVIDNQVRIRAQEKSIQRIEVLLARAKSISEIVSIESQLTERQADLDSLKQRQAWLKDQTSLSTITLYIDHDEEAPAVEDDEHPAFVAGLLDGWNAMKGFGAGLAQVVGALLPFAVLVAVLGVPAAALLRRMRTRTKPEPETA